MKVRTKKDYRKRRHFRVRKKVSGTAERPRMSIMMSNKHIYVQFIDDEKNVTLAAASTSRGKPGKNVAVAGGVGKLAAEAALSKGISSVVVDRGGFLFRKRLRAIVEAVKHAGISTGSGKKPAGEGKEEK